MAVSIVGLANFRLCTCARTGRFCSVQMAGFGRRYHACARWYSRPHSRIKRQHPAIESCLANFGLRGGALIREKSPENFALMVSLSLLAVNVHRLGCMVRDKERSTRRRRRAA